MLHKFGQGGDVAWGEFPLDLFRWVEKGHLLGFGDGRRFHVWLDRVRLIRRPFTNHDFTVRPGDWGVYDWVRKKTA